jgi:nitrate reductase molybdenum cofactor assembly chaperone NarJ/NarW
MSIFSSLAEAYLYPTPGRLNILWKGQEGAPSGLARKAFSAFLESVGRLSLNEWEELHTRTLDLNPPAAPYVGFQIWGESYPRGVFMSQLSHVFAQADIDTAGELPDHLTPILRYLAVTDQPLPELTAVLPAAVERMIKVLQKAEVDNPYILLYQATRAAIDERQPVTVNK